MKIFKENFIFYSVFLFLFLFIFSEAKAATRTSKVGSYLWNNASSWVEGVIPTKNDVVTIVSGGNITVDVDTAKCYELIIKGTLNCSSHILRCNGGSTSIVISGITYTYIGGGNLSINAGGTFNLQTGTLCLTGDFQTTGTFDCGTGTVVFDTKRAPISINGTNPPTFYKVINNDSVPGTYPLAGGFGVSLHSTNTTFKGDVVINGTFNRNNSSAIVTFAQNTSLSGVYSFYLNNIVINSGAVLSANAKNINLYGNWTNNGTFNCGTGSVIFLRDVSNPLVQTVYQANPITNPFYNFVINKATGSVKPITGGANTQGDIYLLNNFTVTKGTWDVAGSGKLYVGGDFSINSTNGVFIADQGRLLMNGSNAVTKQILNTGGSDLYKFTITNTGAGVVLGSDVKVTNEAQFTNGILYTKNGATLHEFYLNNSDPSLSLPLGYSSTSFISGKFRRDITGSNTYIFPVGPLNTTPVLYRPITYQQSAAGGASNLFVLEDTISNTGTYYSNWWARIEPDAGTPSGSLVFSYNLPTDFQSGMTECTISALQGSIPSPTNWNYVLNPIAGPSSGSITATIPTTMSPYAYILGEPVPEAADTSICSGTSTVLTVTSPSGTVSYNWYDAASGGNLLQASSATYTTPTINSPSIYYAASVNSLTGCVSNTIPVTVAITPPPVVSAGSDTCILYGTSVTLSGSASGGSGSYSYSWISTGIVIPNIQNPTTTNLTNSTAFTLSVTDNTTGCHDTDRVTIGVFPDSVTSFPVLSSDVCKGQKAVPYFVSPINNAVTYTWSYSGTGAIITGGSTNSITIDFSGNATSGDLTIFGSNACGNGKDTTIHITVNPLPIANTANDTTVCFHNPVNLSASGGIGYTWSPSSGLNNSAIANPIATPSVTTTYTLIIWDAKFCRDTANVTVNINQLPVANAGNDVTICEGDSATLTATSGAPFYAWSSGDLTQSTIITPSGSGAFTYFVTVTDANNCSASDDVSITVNALPAISSLVSNVTNNWIYSGQEYTITAEPSGYSTYNFIIGSQSPVSGISNSVTSSYADSDTIHIFVSASQNGCVSPEDSISIYVKSFPNAFTPRNNDYINDLFLKGYNISVFNRWGQKIYEGKDGWDGKFNGLYVSKGTYYYVIKPTNISGADSEIKKGSVSVVN
ncbi:MAG: gliding motility-associated C-terminal domain-containing protein [Bacteroidetes bacterium]|nr:gliding motility-associated C-terminal domain-containing protein [Bacteroidota bacterium]